MSDCNINLLPNKYHQKGDNKPCLVNHYQSTIEIKEPGNYTVSIWAPKPGKKTYFMVLKKKEDAKKAQHEPVKENHSNGPVKPIFSDSPFK